MDSTTPHPLTNAVPNNNVGEAWFASNKKGHLYVDSGELYADNKLIIKLLGQLKDQINEMHDEQKGALADAVTQIQGSIAGVGTQITGIGTQLTQFAQDQATALQNIAVEIAKGNDVTQAITDLTTANGDLTEMGSTLTQIGTQVTTAETAISPYLPTPVTPPNGPTVAPAASDNLE